MPPCRSAERRYRLRAWSLIYRHLLEQARLKAAADKNLDSSERYG